MISKTFKEINEKPISKLEEEFDSLANKDTQPARDNRQYLLNVIFSKKANEQGNRIENMTVQMKNMTLIILVLTVINVAAFLYQLICRQ